MPAAARSRDRQLITAACRSMTATIDRTYSPRVSGEVSPFARTNSFLLRRHEQSVRVQIIDGAKPLRFGEAGRSQRLLDELLSDGCHERRGYAPEIILEAAVLLQRKGFRHAFHALLLMPCCISLV